MSSVIKIWNNFWFNEVNNTNLIVFRFILLTLGALFQWYITNVNNMIEINPETFYLTWQPISFYKFFDNPISYQMLAILRYIWLASSFLAGFGFLYNYLIIISFISGVIFLGHDYNFGTVGHSNHLYIMSIGILAISSIFEKLNPIKKELNQIKCVDYNWPLLLIKMYIVYMYFILGFEKLWYGGGLSWAFSESFYLRIFTNPQVTPFGHWVLEQPIYISQFFAAFALFVIELGAPLALINRSFNFIFVILWTLFHVMVTQSFGNHYGFYSQIFCYMVFVDWEFLSKKYKWKQKYQGYKINVFKYN